MSPVRLIHESQRQSSMGSYQKWNETEGFQVEERRRRRKEAQEQGSNRTYPLGLPDVLESGYQEWD